MGYPNRLLVIEEKYQYEGNSTIKSSILVRNVSEAAETVWKSEIDLCPDDAFIVHGRDVRWLTADLKTLVLMSIAEEKGIGFGSSIPTLITLHYFDISQHAFIKKEDVSAERLKTKDEYKFVSEKGFVFLKDYEVKP